MNSKNDFKVIAEEFEDYRILRYQVAGFKNLPLKKKILLYYLYEAALSGRDIIWDQNYRYNLLIRKTLEHILKYSQKLKEDENWNLFLAYLKKIWFSNGIHHHYSMEKIVPHFSENYFTSLLTDTPKPDFLKDNENIEDFISWITPLLFVPEIAAKRVVLDKGVDLLAASANNFYENVNQKEAEEFYASMENPDPLRPLSFGLNSKLVKVDGKVEERVWRVGGMYSAAIERIVFWLEKSIEVAETNGQKAALEKLVEFYKTGNLQTFDEYNILWLNDTKSDVDVINGFIEVYGDALGRKATYELVVQLHDFEGTHRAEIISTNAEWFEMHSPISEEYKKKSISGVSARSINVVVASGDCSPSMPIGINLPNADWIRAEHGSKSVTLANIIDAHTEANKESGIIEEFYWSEYEIELSRKWNKLATQLHVDLHEIIGHGSGRLKEGVAQPHETLKNYASTIEEARADLFALYFAIDPKLVELGLAPSIDVGYAEYNSYITGGLITQLARVEMGKNLEESHMRNRQLIAKWAYEQGFKKNIIEKKRRDGKTFFVINNHDELREIFGKLLHEVQRIKSEGDFRAAKYLIEKYGVKVDRKLHQEALQRWKSLGIPKFSGFMNPVLQPIKKNGKILDISMHYPENFSDQMLFYAKNYSFL